MSFLTKLLFRKMRPVRRPRLRCESLEDRTTPSWTAGLSGGAVSVTASASGDTIQLYVSSAKLTHTISVSGNLTSQYDFDSAAPGEQSVPIGSLTSVNVAGGGNGTLTMGSQVHVAATVTGIKNFYWAINDQTYKDANVSLTNSAFTVNTVPSPYTISFTGLTYAQLNAINSSNVADSGNNTFDASLFTNGNVDMYSYLGNDTLTGGSGLDYLDGADGDDIITGNGGGDTLVGGIGNDTLDGGDGNDQLYGGVGIDIMNGGNNNDGLHTGGGADVCDGGAGIDNMYGDVQTSMVAANGNLIFDGGTSGLNNCEYLEIYGSNTVVTDDTFDASAWTGGNVYFDGRLGNDILKGGSGGDTILGGPGNDQLDGNDGNDNLQGGAGNDTLNGGNNNDGLHTGGGADVVDGGAGTADNFYGDVQLSVIATNSSLIVDGGTPGLNNCEYLEVYGNSSVATNDTFDASTWTQGTVYFDGGLGNDILKGGGLADNLLGGAGNDQLFGNDGNDTLNGGAGNDELNGGNNNDTLRSNGGADVVDGGAGTDSFYGDFQNTLVATNASLILDGGTPGANNCEYLEVYGSNLSATDDNFDASAWTLGYVYFDGRGGNDILKGGSGNDTIHGGAGNDQVFGNDGADNVSGETGIDTLNGGNNDDTLHTGGGADVVDGGAGTDNFYGDIQLSLVATNSSLILDGGTPGANNCEYMEVYGNNAVATAESFDASAWTLGYVYFRGYGGDDVLRGGSGNDTLYGDGGNDTLYGNDGNDNLYGGVGVDTQYGGIGNDGLRTDTGADVIDGGPGTDSCYGNFQLSMVATNSSLVFDGGTPGANNCEYLEIYGNSSVATAETFDASAWTGGNVYFQAYGGNDILKGGSGNDTIYGNDGNDTIDGGPGNDTLQGDNNDDTVTGGAGFDYVYGNAGNDILNDGPETTYTLDGSTGTDTVNIFGTAGPDTLVVANGDVVINGAHISYVAAATETLVIDTLGGIDTGSQTGSPLPANYTVLHLEPTVNAGPDSASQADPFTRVGSFTDIGFGQTWTATIDYGDGSGVFPLTLNPDKTFNISHQYQTGGNFTVTVTVTDNQGNIGSDSFILQRAGIQIGLNGGVQRSFVNTAVVIFPTEVTLNPGWFTFLRTSPGTTPAVNVVSIVQQLGNTVATLQFVNPGIEFSGSLQDGDYRITLNGANITVVSTGLAFDGDGNGSPGGNYQFNFHRYFGDMNGDRTVDSNDYAFLGNSFGLATGDAAFDVNLDYNADGFVDSGDLGFFGTRFGTIL